MRGTLPSRGGSSLHSGGAPTLDSGTEHPVLVTGATGMLGDATGMLGGATVRRLVDLGVPVRPPVRDARGG